MCCEIASAFQILQRGQISMRRKQTVTATYRSTSVLAETNVLGLCDPVDCSPPVRPTRLGTSKKRLSPFVKGLHECGKFFSAPKMLLLFLVTQPCPTLCNPVDSSPPGSPVRGILQARYWSGLPCPPPGDLPNPTDSFLLVNNLCLIRHNSLRDSLHITYIPKESKRLAMLPIIRTLLVDHRYYKGTSLRGFQSKRSF